MDHEWLRFPVLFENMYKRFGRILVQPAMLLGCVFVGSDLITGLYFWANYNDEAAQGIPPTGGLGPGGSPQKAQTTQ